MLLKEEIKKSIMPFLRKLARKANNLMAIAMDMSGPYEYAAREILPKVDIVLITIMSWLCVAKL